MSALASCRILDLSRVVAGPFCTQMLADHGADVVKIEPPHGDETRRLGPPFVGETAAYFVGLNRNKRAMSLDLARSEGRAVLMRLLEGADVLVENFLPGTMEKWGLDYQAVLSARFPRLVYCRISGFGAQGPLGGLPGYDAVFQAICGLMSVNGDDASGPTRIGLPLVDLATGFSAALGILLALAERERSGRGQLVDTTLFDVALGLLHPHAANWLAAGREPPLTGSAHPTISPYDKYRTGNGEIFLGVVNDAQFRKFCAHIGREDLANDERFATSSARLDNRPALRREIEAALAPLDAAELCQDLMRAGVPAGPVNTVSQALEQPHTAARQMVVEQGAYRGLGIPVKLSRTPGEVRKSPPAFGADTRSVLAEAGYTEAEIERLFAAGAAR